MHSLWCWSALLPQCLLKVLAMTDTTKPTPLPDPVYLDYNRSCDEIYGFTADQMTAHELAGYRRGLDAAKKSCIELDNDENQGDYAHAARWCAVRIEALMKGTI